MKPLTTIRDLHREAMRLTDLAFEARRASDEQAALEFFQRALDFERKAAALIADDITNEPARSVLHRSAATLALDARDPIAAERLAAQGLLGNPPSDIADELRDVLDQARFDRHLQLQGFTLARDEFQFVIDGPAISKGMALVDTFVERIRDVERMVLRTGQRLLQHSFIERAKQIFPVFISVPRPASFAVSVKIGTPDQAILPGFEDLLLGQKVVGEVLSCIDLVNTGRQNELQSRFEGADPAYFQNFLALSKKIAPDGANVSFVGFTSTRGLEERQIPFTRQSHQITMPPPPPLTVRSGSDEVLVGRVRFADGVSKTNTIKLVVPNRKNAVTIQVPTGMMIDIVAPLWGKPIRAYVTRYPGSGVVLRTPEEISEEDFASMRLEKAQPDSDELENRMF